MIDAALLLPKILERAGDNREMRETAAKIAWKRAAGEGLFPHALPLRLHEKTLIVAVADGVWQKQLKAMSAELVFRINKLLQDKVVESIEFRIDPLALRRRASATHAQRRTTVPPLPANVVSSAAAIDDPELRERFMRAAENCIARRESIKSEIRNPQSEI
ncbi:MAG TPA: DUF721 domain-containing protein [Pyrinomonadaceae bacterium]|jgi:hypothetical protein